MDKPLLLLDVDGPLNPYAAPARRRPVGYRTIHVGRADGTVYDRNPGRGTVRVWLNPDHGPALLQMAGRFELWWATAWEDRANTIIAPQIGLPELNGPVGAEGVCQGWSPIIPKSTTSS